MVITIKTMITRELYLKQLLNYIDKPVIKIITGIRRSGKSTMLLLLRDLLLEQGVKEEQILYVNFESLTYADLNTAESLYGYIVSWIRKDTKNYLLLDEIQEVKDWEKCINSLIVDFQVDIYLTGSNSHLLSSELATFLSGRYVQIPVYTLSFREYLQFHNDYNKKVITGTEAFIRYLRLGGFPVIHIGDFPVEIVYKIVSDIYSSVILRDTVQRYQIRDIELLERVVRFAMDNIGNTFSGKNVADYFKSQQRRIDINTVYNYLTALEGAFVLYRVPRYDVKGREILKTQKKYYLGDVSILYATMGYKDRQISGVLENLVFLELKRRGYDVYVGKTDTCEIDFVAQKQNKKIYIQVAYRLDSHSTVQREFEPLLSIKDQFPKYVVTMDEFWKESIEGVRHSHFSDFLLSDF